MVEHHGQKVFNAAADIGGSLRQFATHLPVDAQVSVEVLNDFRVGEHDAHDFNRQPLAGNASTALMADLMASSKEVACLSNVR